MNKLRSIRDLYNKFVFVLTVSQKKWGIVVILFTLIGAVCETLGISIILPLVQVMVEPQVLRENKFLSPILNKLQLDTDASLMWAMGIAVILVYLIKNIFLLLLTYIRIKYSCKVQRELSIEMMKSYMDRGYVFFLNTSMGELLRGMRDSITSFYTALYQVFKLVAEGMTIVFICIYIMMTDVVMSLCVIFLAVACLLVVVLVCQKWIKKCGEINYKYSAQISSTLVEAFQGIKEILLMQKQNYFINSYKTKYIKQQKGLIGQTVAAESPTYLIEAVCVMGLIIAVCIKAISSQDAAALVPQLASFAVAAFRILPSLGRISNYYNQLMFCMPGVCDTYNNIKEVREKKEASFIENNLKEKVGKSFQKEISVEHVYWKYPGTEELVLEDISIDIKKGQSVAFVGKSGSGKTTLGDVILGLLIPQSGKIKIDGVDIRELQGEKNQLMGFVPQNVNLLDDTVRKNVAFGVEEKDIEDDCVWRALEKAQLAEVIRNCPLGLDTKVGERGIRFSGGQRQRFAIARALYHDPDILVFDEATSALDSTTETAVMEAINSKKKKKTMIIIAHRLTTIKNCDLIYEIVDGKAVKREYTELL